MDKRILTQLMVIIVMIFSISCSKKTTASEPLIQIHGVWTAMQDFGYGEVFTSIQIDDQEFNFFYGSSEVHCSIQQFDNEAKAGVFKYDTFSDSYLITDNQESYIVNKYRKFTWSGDPDNGIVMQFYPEKSGMMEALAETNPDGIAPILYTKATQCDAPDFNRVSGGRNENLI